MSSRVNSRFARLLLILIGVIAACGIAEALVRTIWAKSMVLYPRYQTGAVYGSYKLRRLIPNASFQHRSIDGSWTFRTNSQGFRSDVDYTYEKPSGTMRVLVLGDSHTQGFEVRQEFTFCAALERMLRQRNVPAEVLNTGISGFGTAEELAFLENEGFRYEPDYVVLAFFVNDFQDNSRSALFKLQDGKLVERQTEYQPGVRIQNLLYSVPGSKWFGEHSYAYSLLFNNVWSFARAVQCERTNSCGQQRPKFEGFESTSDVFHTSEEIALATALIARMQQACRDRGVRFIVAEIPEDVRVAYAYRSSFPRTMAEELPSRCDVPLTCDDWLRDFRGVAEFHVPHGQRHMSEFGHMQLAKVLCDAIQKDRSDKLVNNFTN